MGKASKDARREAQERLAAERAAQQAADRRRTVILGTVTALIIAGIAVGVGFAFVQQSNAGKDVGTLPANVAADTEFGAKYAVVTGTKTSGVPVIDIYEDFQCPACKSFEERAGDAIKKLAEDGKATVNYLPMQFLDANLNNGSSARAANASGCAADRDKFVEFHDEVYANQPAQEGAGYTDADLIKFGASVGLDDDGFAKCVEEQTFAKWALNGVQREAENRPVTSTPTVFVNGQELDRTQYTPEGIEAAVEAAAQN